MVRPKKQQIHWYKFSTEWGIRKRCWKPGLESYVCLSARSICSYIVGEWGAIGYSWAWNVSWSKPHFKEDHYGRDQEEAIIIVLRTWLSIRNVGRENSGKHCHGESEEPPDCLDVGGHGEGGSRYSSVLESRSLKDLCCHTWKRN